MNYTDFLKKYLRYIEENNQSAITKLKSSEINVIKKDDSFKLDIKSAKVIEQKSQEVAFGYNSEWLIINTNQNQSTELNGFFKGDARFFSCDFDDKSIVWEFDDSTDKSDLPDFDHWFLVKANPYFNYRNTNMLINKFESEAFSNIDELLMGEKQLKEQVLELDSSKLSKYTSELDDSQTQAFLGAIEAKDLFVIKGPPGTGKTHVISKIIQYYYENNKRVIFASALHAALDSIVNKMNNNPAFNDAGVVRSSAKATSTKFKNNNMNVEPKIFVTTFASHALHSMFEGEKDDYVLIIDEASACSIFDVFSKTTFANKVIVVGDENQLFPIWSETEYNEFKHFFSDEFKFFHINSLFDSLNKVNKKKIVMLNNNYRSKERILRQFNFFYDNQLQLVRKDSGNFDALKMTSRHDLKKKLEQYKNLHKDTIFITYFKDHVKELNELTGSKVFRTSSSVQGIEANNVVVVLWSKENLNYHLDFRLINVCLSRAIDNLLLIDFDNSLDSPLIKKEGNITSGGFNKEFVKDGDTYTLNEIFEKQTSVSIIKSTVEFIPQESKTTKYDTLADYLKNYYIDLEERLKTNNVLPGFKIVDLKKHQLVKDSPLYKLVPMAELNLTSEFENNEVAFGTMASRILNYYLSDGLTIQKIADELKIPTIPISKTLAFYGISTKANSSRGKVSDKGIIEKHLQKYDQPNKLHHLEF